MWARKVDGVWAEDTPPATVEDRGQWYDLRSLDRALLAYLGWQPVTEVERPADTDASTWDRSIVMVRRVLTVVWTPRDWTPTELADRAVINLGQNVARTDQTGAALLLELVTRDLGTDADVWPTVKSWRALNKVGVTDLATVADVARILVWTIPRQVRFVLAIRKLLRLSLHITTEDTDGTS